MLDIKHLNNVNGCSVGIKTLKSSGHIDVSLHISLLSLCCSVTQDQHEFFGQIQIILSS